MSSLVVLVLTASVWVSAQTAKTDTTTMAQEFYKNVLTAEQCKAFANLPSNRWKEIIMITPDQANENALELERLQYAQTELSLAKRTIEQQKAVEKHLQSEVERLQAKTDRLLSLGTRQQKLIQEQQDLIDDQEKLLRKQRGIITRQESRPAKIPI